MYEIYRFIVIVWQGCELRDLLFYELTNLEFLSELFMTFPLCRASQKSTDLLIIRLNIENNFQKLVFADFRLKPITVVIIIYLIINSLCHNLGCGVDVALSLESGHFGTLKLVLVYPYPNDTLSQIWCCKILDVTPETNLLQN